MVVVIILFIFIQHYLNPNTLRAAPQFESVLGNSTWLVFLPFAPIKTSSAGLLILAFVTIMLSISCLLLLTHLLGFHLYLFYKGISTYDYIKMQRQKETRNRHVEAGISNDAKMSNKAPQNQDPTIDCEPTLSQGPNTCNYDSDDPLATQLSVSICTKLENFRNSERESGCYYGTEKSAENTGEICMSNMKSWKPEADEVQSQSVKPVDSIPRVQDPLGSSVMTPDIS